MNLKIENYQPGAKSFPGYKKKYPKIARIERGAYGKKAIYLEIKDTDLKAVKDELAKEGITVTEITEESTPKTGLIETFKEYLKKLKGAKKTSFKDIEPEELTDKELEEKIKEMESLIDEK